MIFQRRSLSHTFKALFSLISCYSNVSHAGITFPTPPSYTTDLETALRTELFTGYEILQRPDKKVPVEVTFNILTVNDLDIKDQFMSITSYFELKWTDSRLSWSDVTSTSQDFSSIDFLFSTEEYVWRPSLIIDNTVEDFSVIHDKYIPMRILPEGVVIWNPAGIYTIACSSDITYYPLDVQSCVLSLSTWAYTSNEISLDISSSPIDLSYYSENGEWELLSTSGSLASSKSRGDQTFSNVQFTITMRRRPLFHVLNTLFPVALMSFLSAFVFKLPADSGEKMGFTLTVLLAYAVYLTLISDNIPSTSVTTCYLSLYLALILVFGSLAVLCSILVLNVYFRPEDEEISKLWRIATRIMVLITCWSQPSSTNCKPRYQSCWRKTNPNKVQSMSTEKTALPIEEKSSIHKPEADKEALDQDEMDITWKTVSLLLDRFFFIVFFLMIGITTVVFFGIIFSEYNAA